MQERVIVAVRIFKKKKKLDIDIPLDISANELIIALNSSLDLDFNVDDITNCYLKTENPIALVKGKKTLREFGIRNGTTINITN